MTSEIKSYLLGLGGMVLCVAVGYGLQKDMEQAAYKIGSLTETAHELNNKISELQAENRSLRYQSEKEVAEKYAKLDLSKLHVTCNQDVEYSRGVARLKDWTARSVEGLIIVPATGADTIKTCKQLFDKFGVTGTINEPSANAAFAVGK